MWPIVREEVVGLLHSQTPTLSPSDVFCEVIPSVGNEVDLTPGWLRYQANYLVDTYPFQGCFLGYFNKGLYRDPGIIP